MSRKEGRDEDQKSFDWFDLSIVFDAFAYGFVLAAAAVLFALGLAIVPIWNWLEERGSIGRDKGQGG